MNCFTRRSTAFGLVAFAIAAGAHAQNFVTVTPRVSDSFVDTIGVNTHVNYVDTNYVNWYEVIRPKLLGAGIRHVREFAFTWNGIDRNTYVWERLRALDGVKFDLLIDRGTNFATLANIPAWLDGRVEAFEGPNEVDIQGNDNWPSDTRTLQTKLYNTVKNSPKLSSISVLSPSFVGEPVAMGSVSAICDYGNLHVYFGGGVPTTTTNWGYTEARKIMGTRPSVITETGYHNAMSTSSGHLPTSEAATGKYGPRLLLNNFNAGVALSYMYEMIEPWNNDGKDPEKAFGLLRGDGSEKPIYQAIKNMIALTKDPGASFAVKPLKIAIQGGDANTKTSLLQKRDGTYLLAVWQEAASWNPDTRKDMTVPPKPITLLFDRTFYSATTYLPSRSAKSVSTVLNLAPLKVNSLDEVTLIELKSKPTIIR